jgi:hypothetical protein
MHRKVTEVGGTYILPESNEAYASDCASKSDVLTSNNIILWERSAEYTET